MTVTRLAISLDKELAREIRRSAAGQPISTWIAEAARRKLRSEGMLAVIADWEAEHGELTEAELQAADQRLTEALRRRRKPTVQPTPKAARKSSAKPVSKPTPTRKRR